MPLQNTIPVKDTHVVERPGASFIPLTDQDTIIGLVKRLRENPDPTAYWATLGRQDSGAIIGQWAGNIVCSKQGNNSFTTRGRKIQEEAAMIRELIGGSNPDKTSIYEKFVDLDGVTSWGAEAGARNLRLTITLQPEEEALAFLQHTDPGDATSGDGFFEYLVPVRQEDRGKRNLYTYHFSVPPVSVDGPSRFVVKVITFRNVAEEKLSIAETFSLLRKFDNPYGISLFNPDDQTFVPVPGHAVATSIDATKKTLLLIHGTFASVEKSYGDLRTSGWLREVMQQGKRYEQIIGFDHYTVVESPESNVQALLKLLEPAGTFTEPVDVITTSRGGLVGKYLVNHPTQEQLTIGRVATVACANGVAYMDRGEDVVKLLSILRYSAPNPLVQASLLALQHAAKNFLEQPGLSIMKKDDEDLVTLLGETPRHKQMRYYPVCGDYRLRGQHPLGWKFVDLALSGLMIDGHHDWVVETDYQVKMPAGYYAYNYPQEFFRSQPLDTTHTRYFNNEMNAALPVKAQELIYKYLHDTDENILGTTPEAIV